MNDRPKQTQSLQKPSDAGRAEFGKPKRTDTSTLFRGRRFTHQGFRLVRTGFVPLCRACVLAPECPVKGEGPTAYCKPLAKARDRMIRQILSLPHIDPQLDLPLVTQYVNARLFCVLCELYATRTGIFLPGGGRQYLEVQPALSKAYVAYANLARRTAEALLLTPAARRAIEERGGAADVLVKVLRQVSQRPLEAEFEVEDESENEQPKGD